MGRPERTAVGNMIYHVLNRANGRERIFYKEKDYQAFETIIEEAKQKYPMRILAYCLMPNHWHFLVYPYKDNDLSLFFQWVTLTHTQRWRVHYDLVGYGHFYQGRFKSFPIQQDEYFLTAARYVERNALRAKLVSNAHTWRWGSAWRRIYGTSEQKNLLSPWPVPPPDDYEQFLNKSLPGEGNQLREFRTAIQRGRPYGDDLWVRRVVSKFGLESTLRPRGRPWDKGS